MFYLVYVSSCRGLMSRSSVQQLLHQCVERNGPLGITGILLYQSGNFLQLLEGPQEVVETLYEKISGDPRHHQVTRVLSGNAPQRLFPNWSMAYKNLADLPERHGYHALLDQKLGLRGFAPGQQRVLRFIGLFVQNNP
ncbi:MAG: BLUF domain-containing protein [Rhodocyclaceae bacterium]|nr:BLUF domain-containing protein [Rhodocyclaceae bacterium]